MGFFKKLGKAIKKAARSPVGRILAAAATGGQSETLVRVAQAVKSTGAQLKGRAPNVEPLQVRALVEKHRVPSAAARIDVRPVARPGGAPMRHAAAPKRRKATRTLPARAKAPQRAKGKRQAPKGGLDLKALSRSWRAAGKPGTWQGWIKANG